jgi:hypothetical protein
MDVALAIVDRNTLAIDAYYQNTGDYASYNGHIYSDKAPGSSFLAVPAYIAFKILGGRAWVESASARLANSAFATTLAPNGRGLLADSLYYFAALTFVTFFIVAVPSALLGVLFFRLLGHFSTNLNHRVLLTLGFGLATPAFAYANNLYSHQIIAFFLFASFYALFRLSREMQAARLSALLFVVGLAFGWALLTEYPSALVVAALFLYGCYKVRSPRHLIWLAVGVLPPLALGAAYNYAIFGTPLPVGYRYSATWQAEHGTGFIGFVYPLPDAFWGITFSLQRGLFFLSPFLLLAIPGFYLWGRSQIYRAEFFVTLWVVVSFLLFISSTINWLGGLAVGPRYLVPMLPFISLPIIFVLDATRARWQMALIGLLMAISAAIVWAQTLGGQLFPQYQPNPLFEYSLPRLVMGDIARNAGMLVGLGRWASLVPLLVLLGSFCILYLYRIRMPGQRIAEETPV